jgi:hypothetical protein
MLNLKTITKEDMITSNNGSAWTKSDRKTLKTMVKEGKAIKDIAAELGRTPAAVIYQKSQMGLTKVTKSTKVPKVKNKNGKLVIPAAKTKDTVPTVTTRDKAKEMTSAARQIARANGKRITMAMFFVEDL